MVRTAWWYKSAITSSMRIAHLADAFGRTAEVHGGGLPNLHLCCAIRNTTWYESMVLTNPVVKETGVDENGEIHAPSGSGIGWEPDVERLQADGLPAGR